jgi:tRNA(fMet)-specific endonuclease VapC
MILLDTDHLSVLLDSRHRLRAQLLERLEASEEAVAVSIIAVEEQLRAWLAEIHRVRDAHRKTVPYLRLRKLLLFFELWPIADWNEAAADVFVRLRESKVRIGSQDLQIAAVAIANDAVLLSANLRDFERIPGLRVEDWLYSS